jgi:FkbM family methyltransferase
MEHLAVENMTDPVEVMADPQKRMGITKVLARGLLPREARNWLRSSVKSIRWVWGEWAYYLGIRETISMRPGFSLQCHPLAYAHAYFAQLEDPDQIQEFDTFISSCTPGMRLLDIGAHFGLFSLACLHYGGPSAQAIAVDASPTAARMMDIQSRLNQAADRLRVVQACVCERTGVRQMVSVGVLADGYYVAPALDHTERDKITVDATTIDHMVEHFRFQPTHVKIDVEGFENLVLTGGRRTLSSNSAPIIFLELHNEIVRVNGDDPVQILTMLRGWGYSFSDSNGSVLSDEDILTKPLIRIVGRKQTASL